MDEGREASDDDANADTQHPRLSGNQKSLHDAEDDSDEVRGPPTAAQVASCFCEQCRQEFNRVIAASVSVQRKSIARRRSVAKQVGFLLVATNFQFMHSHSLQ